MARVDHSALMVAFPTDSPHSPSAAPHTPDTRFHPAQYLPFRRISLPTSPSAMNRKSVVSVSSFDSLHEEGSLPGAAVPALIRGIAKGKQRLHLGDTSRKSPRRRESKPSDDQRDAKRRKVINEFHDTERSYVDGLELIYSHFLTPIIASLDTPHPLLDRTELTSVFSNFIDIWNFHRSFYSSLTTYLSTSKSSSTQDGPPPLSPILLSHFPYLSLYTPFITSFPDALSSYTTLLSNNPPFASFIAQQEADPRCGKLKLRDWLLTIVQRCPRYLLLLKDLIGCTDPEDPEHASLTAAHALVSKITVSLNTSLHTHAQTLALLALQRSTSNLPFQLITPGRTFLKRSPLLQLEGSTPKEREFLLFSDCVVWFASADKADDADFSSKWEIHPGSRLGLGETAVRPRVMRSRSKSEAELSKVKPQSPLPSSSSVVKHKESGMWLRLGGSPSKKARQGNSSVDERWVYKGHVDLVDVEVVVGSHGEHGEDKRFEILSPQGSFAVYAASEEDRDEWCSAIRNAKSSLLVSLNAMHPNSTLTSSSSTNHLRRTLQALPYAPEEQHHKPKRGKVEHFVPAVWIPDGKSEGCMRCGRPFSWRRRRHHCRLCGRCICASCSGKTFFILDSNEKSTRKSARACDTCYDTVFPLLHPTPAEAATSTMISHLTLSGFKSLPSLLLGEEHPPSALMAIDLVTPSKSLPRIEDNSPPAPEPESGPSAHVPAIRIRPPSARPRSYVHILEDFHDFQTSGSANEFQSPVGSASTSRFSARMGLGDGVLDEEEEEEPELGDRSAESVEEAQNAGAVARLMPSPRKEDTARRHKRFSMPAIAIQTTPVTARPNVVGAGKSRRFSLVLGGGGGSRIHHEDDGLRHGVAAGKLSELLRRGKNLA